MRNLIIIGFVVMVLAQWAVPVTMIRGAHEIIDQGVEFKFKTRPVDPSDPFRGKYVTLDFEAETYHPTDTNELHFEAGQELFAILIPDPAGFANILDLTAEKPEVGLDYMNVKFQYGTPGFEYEVGPEKIKADPVITVSFPFNRFYVEESKASDAEQLYWATRSDSTQVCYAKVKVYNGKATLVDVMINDRPMMDIVRELNASKE